MVLSGLWIIWVGAWSALPWLEAEFLELGLDGFGPDLVALFLGVEGVGHDLFGEDAFGGEEFIGDVEVVNTLAVVEF